MVVMGLYWTAFTVAEVAAEAHLAPVIPAMWAPDVIVVTMAIWLIHRSMRADSRWPARSGGSSANSSKRCRAGPDGISEARRVQS